MEQRHQNLNLDVDPSGYAASLARIRCVGMDQSDADKWHIVASTQSATSAAGGCVNAKSPQPPKCVALHRDEVVRIDFVEGQGREFIAGRFDDARLLRVL